MLILLPFFGTWPMLCINGDFNVNHSVIAVTGHWRQFFLYQNPCWSSLMCQQKQKSYQDNSESRFMTHNLSLLYLKQFQCNAWVTQATTSATTSEKDLAKSKIITISYELVFGKLIHLNALSAEMIPWVQN